MIVVKKSFILLVCIIISMILSQAILAKCTEDATFPLRKVFLTVDCINMNDFISNIEEKKVIIVDARNNTEYKIIRIKEAINIPIDDKRHFIEQVKLLRQRDSRPMVFYCNGKTCNISYKAAKLSMEAGIRNVLVFDGGIFEYSQTSPTNTLLLDKPISTSNRPISTPEFTQHLLDVKEFNDEIMKHIDSEKSFTILDVRAQINQQGLSIYSCIPNNKHIALNKTEKLKRYLKKIAENNDTLFVYDWSGRQLRWIQYYIDEEGVNNYYFLHGGAATKINHDLRAQGLPEMNWLTNKK